MYHYLLFMFEIKNSVVPVLICGILFEIYSKEFWRLSDKPLENLSGIIHNSNAQQQFSN